MNLKNKETTWPQETMEEIPAPPKTSLGPSWAKIATDNAAKPLKSLPPQPGLPKVLPARKPRDGATIAIAIAKKPTECKTCKSSEASKTPKHCQLCAQKGREKIQDTHCMNCCGFCPHCDRRGHQLYNEDGSYQCFKMATCDICGEKGHNTDFCRRDWCSVCRTDGLGDNYIGHATERCFKRHLCTTCNEVGHVENRCPTLRCKKCDDARHTTEQCERDMVCEICEQAGHSAKRCRKCAKCGFGIFKDKPHKCRRDEYGQCKECGGKGMGKCACLQYVSRPPRRF